MPSKNNPKQLKAVSLQYSNDDPAPKVTSKGQGYIAQQIIEKAEQHHIPIQKDNELVSLLSQVKLDQEIPEKLYQAVAQVLIFAYQVSGKELPSNKEEKS